MALRITKLVLAQHTLNHQLCCRHFDHFYYAQFCFASSSVSDPQAGASPKPLSNDQSRFGLINQHSEFTPLLSHKDKDQPSRRPKRKEQHRRQLRKCPPQFAFLTAPPKDSDLSDSAFWGPDQAPLVAYEEAVELCRKRKAMQLYFATVPEMLVSSSSVSFDLQFSFSLSSSSSPSHCPSDFEHHHPSIQKVGATQSTADHHNACSSIASSLAPSVSLEPINDNIGPYTSAGDGRLTAKARFCLEPPKPVSIDPVNFIAEQNRTRALILMLSDCTENVSSKSNVDNDSSSVGEVTELDIPWPPVAKLVSPSGFFPSESSAKVIINLPVCCSDICQLRSADYVYKPQLTPHTHSWGLGIRMPFDMKSGLASFKPELTPKTGPLLANAEDLEDWDEVISGGLEVLNPQPILVAGQPFSGFGDFKDIDSHSIFTEESSLTPDPDTPDSPDSIPLSIILFPPQELKHSVSSFGHMPELASIFDCHRLDDASTTATLVSASLPTLSPTDEPVASAPLMIDVTHLEVCPPSKISTSQGTDAEELLGDSCQESPRSSEEIYHPDQPMIPLCLRAAQLESDAEIASQDCLLGNHASDLVAQALAKASTWSREDSSDPNYPEKYASGGEGEAPGDLENASDGESSDEKDNVILACLRPEARIPQTSGFESSFSVIRQQKKLIIPLLKPFGSFHTASGASDEFTHTLLTKASAGALECEEAAEFAAARQLFELRRNQRSQQAILLQERMAQVDEDLRRLAKRAQMTEATLKAALSHGSSPSRPTSHTSRQSLPNLVTSTSSEITSAPTFGTGVWDSPVSRPALGDRSVVHTKARSTSYCPLPCLRLMNSLSDLSRADLPQLRKARNNAADVTTNSVTLVQHDQYKQELFRSLVVCLVEKDRLLVFEADLARQVRLLELEREQDALEALYRAKRFRWLSPGQQAGTLDRPGSFDSLLMVMLEDWARRDADFLIGSTTGKELFDWTDKQLLDRMMKVVEERNSIVRLQEEANNR